jgi:glycosyltransferase involved in cell wall biosynthesis
MKAPISLCLIARNEGARLEKCLKSIRDFVEEVVVVDTGSTDNTLEIARKYADIVDVFTDCNRDGGSGKIKNFAMARNHSFSLATKEWVFWVDADDTVVGGENLAGLIEKADGMIGAKPAMILLPYEYAKDEYGNVRLRHYRERIIKKKDYFHWVNRVHEVLIPKAKEQDHFYFKQDDLTIVHNRGDKQTDPFRNLEILKEVYE